MPRKGSFGEISAIQAELDKGRTGGDRPGYIIVKTFRQIRKELDAQGKTTAQISSNGVLQIFDLGDGLTENVDLEPNDSGTANKAARADHHHHLDEDIAPTWTSPHLWVVPTAEITPATGALSLTATLPATDMTGAGVPRGVTLAVTSPAGSDTPTSQSHGISAMNVTLLPGYTGTAASAAASFINTIVGAGASEYINPLTVGTGPSKGVYARASGTANGYNIGAHFQAHGGARNYGVLGDSQQPNGGSPNIGVAGFARNTSSAIRQIGVWAALFGPASAGAAITIDNPVTRYGVGSALVADNGSETGAFIATFYRGGGATPGIAWQWAASGAATAIGAVIGAAEIPLRILSNASQSANLFQVMNSGATSTLYAVDPSGRSRYLETTTPTHVANTGFLYTKDFSGRTELCYFDSDGASTGVEIRLTQGGLVSGGHVIRESGTPLTQRQYLNFTTGIVATDDSGGAETEVALDEAYSPTWTGFHTWEPPALASTPGVSIKAGLAQTNGVLDIYYYDGGLGANDKWVTFDAGSGGAAAPFVTLGALGSGGIATAKICAKLSAAQIADASTSAFNFVVLDSLTSASAVKFSNSADAKDILVMGPTGEIAVGYKSGLQATPGIVLSMIGTTTDLATVTQGMVSSVRHNGSVTPTFIGGMRAQVANQVTTTVAGQYWGMRGDVSSVIGSSPTVGTAELACIVGSYSTLATDSQFDYTNGIGNRLRGAWPRVAAFRAGFIAGRTGIGNVTPGSAMPVILSSLYAPINSYGSTCWGVEIDNPSGSSANVTVDVAGGIKIPHPRTDVSDSYGTRAMHAYFVPYTFQHGFRSGNVKGDVVFDDTNNGSGLHQYTTAWRKLLVLDDFVSWEDDAVFYDDELVLPI